MGAFGGMMFTNKGRNLETKAQTGVQLKYTRIALGDGELKGASVLDLKKLINEKKSLQIRELRVQEAGRAVIGALLTNHDITTGFYFREIGIFAQDPDEGEILYCYANAGTNAEYIPAGGGSDIIEKYVYANVIISNATNVTAVIDQSLVFAKLNEFNDLKAAYDSHKADSVIHITQAERAAWNAKETPAGAQAKVDAHKNDTTIHISAAERTAWNAKETPAGAQAKVDAHANDTVKHITAAERTGWNARETPAGAQAKVDAHANRKDNPHGVTTTQIGAETPAGAQTRADKALTDAKAYTDSKVNEVVLKQSLGPSANLINADQASAVDLTVYGVMLTNRLGDLGTLKDANADGVADTWRRSPAGQGKYTFNGNYQKIESLSSDTLQNERYIASATGTPHNKVIAGRKYIAIVDAESDGVSTARLVLNLGSNEGNPVVSVTTKVNKTLYVKLVTVADSNNAYIALANYDPAGTAGWVQFRNVDFCEVTDDTLWNAIGTTITESNIRDYIPHIDGRKPVQGIVITKQGKNLIPPFTEWITKRSDGNFPIDKIEITSNYVAKMTRTSGSGMMTCKIRTAPNSKHTLAFETNDNISVYVYDSKMTQIATKPFLAGKGQLIFDSTTGTDYEIGIYISSTTPNTSAIIYYPMLTISTVEASFEPREDQRVLLPATLGEVNGVRDEVTVRGTEATLNRRVSIMNVLDGSQSWVLAQGLTGFKRIRLDNVYYGITNSEVVTKFNGKLLVNNGGNYPAADISGLYNPSNVNTNLNITVDNADTGWTDTLNPNANAVKALMNGWKATANDSSKYTSWVSILDGKAATTNTEAWVAANKAPGWTGWATLDYALATPVISKVNDADGSISLHPGGNVITVESGAIFKEPIIFKNGNDGFYYSNTTSGSFESTVFKKRVKKILRIDEGIKTNVPFLASTANMYGLERPKIKVEEFNPNAQYFASYLTLDNYSYSANVSQTDVQYKVGLNGTVSDAVNNIARLTTENDAQNYAEMYIQALAENNKLDIVNHKEDYVKHQADGGTTAGTSTAYTCSSSPNPTALVDKTCLVITAHVDSGANPTIKWGTLAAAPIKKANGNPATLKKDGIYTLRYSAGTAAFILQGEGGEYGDATAAHVLNPKTIGTDTGLVTGTMVNNGGKPIVSGATMISAVRAHGSDPNSIIIDLKPTGAMYVDANTVIQQTVNYLIDSNIKHGVKVGNLQNGAPAGSSITGTFTSDGVGDATWLLEGAVMYSKGVKYAGSMKNWSGKDYLVGYGSIKKYYIDGSDNVPAFEVTPPTGGYLTNTTVWKQRIAGLYADRIAHGQVIGNTVIGGEAIVTGTFTSDGNGDATWVLESGIMYSKGVRYAGAIKNYNNKTFPTVALTFINKVLYDDTQKLGSIQFKPNTAGYVTTTTDIKLDVSNLLPSNIKAGVMVGNPGWTDGYMTGTFTSDGTVNASRILAGFIGYALGVKYVGTMPNYIGKAFPLMSSGYIKAIDVAPLYTTVTFQPNGNGYIDSTSTLQVQIDNLRPENIKHGIEMGNVDNQTLVVTGTFTSDGTLLDSSSLLAGLIAYSRGMKYTGTMQDLAYSTMTVGSDKMESIEEMTGGYIGSYFTYKPNIYGRITDTTKFKMGVFGITPNSVQFGQKYGVSGTGLFKTGTYTSDGNITAGDLAVGKVAYSQGQRIAGTGTNSKRYATGQVTSGSSLWQFTLNNDGSIGRAYPAEVLGLAFKPSTILLYFSAAQVMYNENQMRDGYRYVENGYKVFWRLDGTQAYVTQGGFRVPTDLAAATYTWYAYE
ncbi:hypothetical protein BVG16_16300 [Paenibacillus selenitireducens]|uniref:Phage tail fibre protein N-terminal domain-containing protein n=1 Tax=Paenibacillus selenitireducens TaxID=1324314 RepID=A0A1T2XA15_9BACL|nr:phage tail protein [Paenibacillus selenitireducens]OPA76731.1 hypothetical protein BVG16_16300 [Paenibacillus selenitireducens]